MAASKSTLRCFILNKRKLEWLLQSTNHRAKFSLSPCETKRIFLFLSRFLSLREETMRGGQNRGERKAEISPGNANEWNGLIGKYQIHDIGSVSISWVRVFLFNTAKPRLSPRYMGCKRGNSLSLSLAGRRRFCRVMLYFASGMARSQCRFTRFPVPS